MTAEAARISETHLSDNALADAEARRRIRFDLETTLVVEAAAGTGKTTELVSRILGLLRF
ncbi:MAG: UvrD-helicase domain-containing protein, partial [Gemmatimonadaceae bacterium]|nr:UvrD-helicase domain-containing protein [Gemmatimonadaceae bacterium]